jgi:asparagine synthetase B (glutamine-hydrolysing)
VVTANERALRWLGADAHGRASAAVDDVVLGLERRGAPGPDAMYAFLAGAYLPNNGFLLADKLGMGNSVEVRVPFADHVLFERVVGLPLARRYARGESKPLLKRLLRRGLPAAVLERPKQGFTPPNAFIRAIVAAHADAVLSAPQLCGWLDPARLRALVTAYLAQPAAHPSRADRLARRGRVLLDGFAPEDVEWTLYSLAAFVKSQEGWR